MKFNTINFYGGLNNHPFLYPSFYPKYIKKAKNGVIYADNQKFIDLWMGFGSVILGHSFKPLNRLLKKSLEAGIIYSSPISEEKKLFSIITHLFPSIEKIKICLTGSEAVKYAIDLSIALSDRNRILSIEGDYHGSFTMNLKNLKTIPFNNIDRLSSELNSKKYACFILEPIMCNKGIILPNQDYLKKARDLCTQTGTILIFDETITGLRVGNGGAQAYFKIRPDLTILSKSLANGIPIAILGGKKHLMDMFMPKGSVFFGGTFYGNALSIRATLFTLKYYQKYHDNLIKSVFNLKKEISWWLKRKSINDINVISIGSMLFIFWGKNLPQNYKDFKKNFSIEKWNKFIKILLKEEKIFPPPLYTEPFYFSVSHRPLMEKIKEKLIRALNKVV
ncbi:MAG: aminotransferase class III-fold pyridoxal phosphate-dependent enzyme [Nanopusillaceae archaeon]